MHSQLPPLQDASSTETKDLPPCDCASDPVEGLKQMFVDYAQGKRIASGEVPAQRPVFRRMHGVAHGTFRVRQDLPESLRVGVFAQKQEYPVWVRFSSDVQSNTPDLRGTCGIAIKLFGVEGRKVMTPDQDALTHDFLLQNFDVFFTDTARDMCEFTHASLQGSQQRAAYLQQYPTTAEILTAMQKVVPTVLGTPYWSVLPFRFGKARYAKYKLEPMDIPPRDGASRDSEDPFYLRKDLHARLKNGASRFRFMVQLRTDDETMPLDRATVRWSEELSPPIHVATLELPPQDLDTRGQDTYGENLAYNTWHALPEHEPVGSIAEARKVAYRASAENRRNVNGVPLAEPVEPRPAEPHSGSPYPQAKDTVIVRAAIHPAIGIARVGNSEEFFVGPEVVEPLPHEAGFYRDGAGALKRQAARFRIYGYNAAGEVVGELTSLIPQNATNATNSILADIAWRVHVANHKASWYDWEIALDIPEAAPSARPRRNATVKGDARRQLSIDGGERSIQGAHTYGSQYRFEGQFQGTPVYLGELRTDESGRLLFLGGLGRSASPTGASIYPKKDNDTGFINADGWYDDVSDGPVSAEVSIAGRKIPVEPAWVVTAPPNYAPDAVGVRTLYDLLLDLNVTAGILPFPSTVSFRQDVYPLLLRLSSLQWVNQGFAVQFGHGGPSDFQNSEFVRKLAWRPSKGGYDVYAELRLQVLHSFRDPQGSDNNPLPWPWLYGDATDTPPANTPRQNAAISPTQYRILQAWAAGSFVSDWDSSYAPARTLEDVPLTGQPGMLDRSALHFCLADAFHPGCEVTWPIRHLSMFSAPFRIRHRPAGVPAPDYGDVLTPALALSLDGPLYAQGPGDLTRWMGLPWQADTAYCRSGYSRNGYAYDPYLPTFWPAHVPNQVLTVEAYQVVMDERRPREERLAAYAQRANWLRFLNGPAADQMAQMVATFGDMGVVELRPGPANDPDFPPMIGVESVGPQAKQPTPVQAPVETMAPEQQPKGAQEPSPRTLLQNQAIQNAGWKSTEEAEDAPFPVHIPR
ncbi:LodA/GoxA family CTQ-dependent oxidase [Hyalangium versicolor]|uniref:LodA/GoxA family CTQ-dependent oxidase n=1 Tax=Hyalangium versicolor TaxID=2861190 RepID=UPI001CCCFA68|nr:LodA/GoxA family CTQ-dependent oxidase [Hyalangium versicolor]